MYIYLNIHRHTHSKEVDDGMHTPRLTQDSVRREQTGVWPWDYLSQSYEDTKLLRRVWPNFASPVQGDKAQQLQRGVLLLPGVSAESIKETCLYTLITLYIFSITMATMVMRWHTAARG